jgi:hypothetical protein
MCNAHQSMLCCGAPYPAALFPAARHVKLTAGAALVPGGWAGANCAQRVAPTPEVARCNKVRTTACATARCNRALLTSRSW